MSKNRANLRFCKKKKSENLGDCLKNRIFKDEYQKNTKILKLSLYMYHFEFKQKYSKIPRFSHDTSKFYFRTRTFDSVIEEIPRSLITTDQVCERNTTKIKTTRHDGLHDELIK